VGGREGPGARGSETKLIDGGVRERNEYIFLDPNIDGGKKILFCSQAVGWRSVMGQASIRALRGGYVQPEARRGAERELQKNWDPHESSAHSTAAIQQC